MAIMDGAVSDLKGLGFSVSHKPGETYVIVQCKSCPARWAVQNAAMDPDTGMFKHGGNFIFFVEHSYQHKVGKKTK